MPSKFGDLLADWLLARELPSNVTTTHPYVEVLPVARFYEQGRGLEGEFIVSWDDLETFYRDSAFEQAPFALQFIASLRHLGFDRSLRAGQSMWRMIVSRSRRHRLEADQNFVTFDFQSDHVQLGGKLSNQTLDPLTCRKPQPSPEVISMLRDLVDCPIDVQWSREAG